MRKRNHTVTIRMNKEEYDLFQSKVKESGRTQQWSMWFNSKQREEPYQVLTSDA